MNEYGTIFAMVIGACLLILGLVVGYWRGTRRTKQDKSLDALADVGQAILGAQLNLDALCEIIYQQATRVIDTRNFQLGVVRNNNYHTKVWLKDAARLPNQVFTHAASEGLVGWVVQNKTGMLVFDFQKEWDSLPARPRYYDKHNPARAAIFSPLIAGGQVIGVIAAQSVSPRAFSEEDLRRLTVLSHQASGALYNAYLYENVQKQAERLRLIGRVSRQITAMQPLSDLFLQIVDLVKETFGYYAVNVFTINKKSQELVLGASSTKTFKNITMAWGKGLVGWSAQHQELVHVPVVTEDARYFRSAALEATKSEVVVPLIVENQVLGVLDIQSNLPDAFTADDLKTLSALGDQLAIAIQESITYDQEHKQGERLNALIEAARAVVSILDTTKLLDEVVELIDDYFGFDRVHLFINDDERITFRNGSGLHVKQWSQQNLKYQHSDQGFVPWVVRHGRPLISGNVAIDDRYVAGIGLEDTISEMTVPIQMGRHVLGVLDIQSKEQDAFSHEDLALVQALSDTVAIALRNARLFANETRRRILSETLREVSMVLASSLDLESVLKEILLGLERVVNYTAAAILLRNDEQNTYQISAIHGNEVQSELWGIQLVADSTFEAELEKLLNNIARQDDSSGDFISESLTINRQHIGHIAIKRTGDAPFIKEEKEIVGTFANQAGVAIMNAQLYMAQKEEAWISTALLQVAEATGQAISPDDVLQTVAKITPLLAGVEWCAVFLREEERFHMVEVAGLDRESADRISGFHTNINDWNPLQELVERGTPIIVSQEDIPKDRLPISVNFLQAVLLPLFAKGEVFGMLMIGQRQGDQPLTARKIELASGIANQAAIAIDRAQLYTAQQEEQWITTVILQVAEAVNSQFDLDSTLEAIVRYTTLLVGVTRCSILQWYPDQEYFMGSKSFGLVPEAEDTLLETTFPLEDNPFLQHLTTESGIITAGENEPFPLSDDLRHFFPSTDSILAIPLSAQGQTVGAMIVDQISLEGAGEQRRLNILAGIADQCALAIKTARLQDEALAARSFEREMELARTIQLSLLPDHPPQLPAWDIAAYYRPARLVGGDFYDFIELSDGKYGLVIADVTDKGVPAAMFMTICRTIIRAVASSKRGPLETLRRVNKILVNDNRSDLFVTVWYGIIDTHSNTLSFCSAGHNPPILVRSNGQFHELRLKGIALGILEGITLNESSITLDPDDLLVAYTDGLTEARRSDDTEFGEADLYINAVKFRSLSAEALMQRIVQAVDNFTGDLPAFDDLTLFILKRLEERD